MYLKMKSIRLECGGCPTSYSGETVDGKTVEMRLRHGSLSIAVNGRRIVNEAPCDLDGVCSLEDFISYASRNGHFIDTDNAEYTSQLQDTEELIQKLYANKVWVTFIKEFHSATLNKTFKVDEKYTTTFDGALTMLKLGLVIVESEHDQEKLWKHKLISDSEIAK